MKNLLKLLMLLVSVTLSAQYTRWENKGYDNSEPDELILLFTPIYSNRSEEINQFEMGYRSGWKSFTYQYGVDNARNQYHSLNFTSYPYINRWLDLYGKVGAGFVDRKITGEQPVDKYQITYDLGVSLKLHNLKKEVNNDRPKVYLNLSYGSRNITHSGIAKVTFGVSFPFN